MQSLRTSLATPSIVRSAPSLIRLSPPSRHCARTITTSAKHIRPSMTETPATAATSRKLEPRSTGTLSTAARPTSSAKPWRSTAASSRSLSSLSLSKTKTGVSYSTAASATHEPAVHGVFEGKTGSWQYVVADRHTSTAVIIDPVLDYNAATGTISTETADSLLDLINEQGYTVDMILETHAHADHITAASYLQHRLTQIQKGHRPLIGIGKRIVQVQARFSQQYGVPAQEFEGVFDKLIDDNEIMCIGDLTVEAIHLPGHTPDHMGYKVGDNVFVGDSVFHVDLGSARADFPGGDAQSLFRSGRKVSSLPDHVKIWVGHDYPPDGRDPIPYVTVREHRDENKHLKDGTTEEEFIDMRQARDATLGEPKLLHQSLQMNIRAGRLPSPGQSGLHMLHIPLKLSGLHW